MFGSPFRSGLVRDSIVPIAGTRPTLLIYIPKVSVRLIHQTRVAVHLVCELDCTAGEFVAVTTGQDNERLHDLSHVHNESHEYQLRVFPIFWESLITFVERCVNDVHVLVEGIEPYSSGSNDNHTCNERDNIRSCRVRYDR